jgi:hypothetical protein
MEWEAQRIFTLLLDGHTDGETGPLDSKSVSALYPDIEDEKMIAQAFERPRPERSSAPDHKKEVEPLLAKGEYVDARDSSGAMAPKAASALVYLGPTGVRVGVRAKIDSLQADSISSILGVAGAGFRLSLLLNAAYCEITNADPEVRSISKSVTDFSGMLKQIVMIFRMFDSVHLYEAVETARSIAYKSTRVFDEINDMLDRVRADQRIHAYAPTIQQRFRWCFKKHRVAYLLALLESYKLSLSVMLQITQLGTLMASTSRRYDRVVEIIVYPLIQAQ